MILRVSVSALHVFLAAIIGLGAAWMWVQSQLNLRWEIGFYDEPTVPTVVLLVSSLMMLALAAFQAVSSFGFALGYRWGAWGVLIVSMVLVLGAPVPLMVLLAAGAGLVMTELWITRPRPPPEDDD